MINACSGSYASNIAQELSWFRDNIADPIKKRLNFIFGYAMIYKLKYIHLIIDNKALLAELPLVEKGYIFGTENITSYSNPEYTMTLWQGIPTNPNMMLFAKYNICNGITISKLDGDIIELWAYMSDTSDTKAQSFYKRSTDVLMAGVYNFNKQRVDSPIPNRFSTHNFFELKYGFDPSVPPIDGYENEKQNVQAFLRDTYSRDRKIETDDGIAELTSKEMQVCSLLVDGHRPKEIAIEIGNSYRTIEQHIESAKIKTGANNTVCLIKFYLNTMNRRLKVA